jgi:hypothetical protein
MFHTKETHENNLVQMGLEDLVRGVEEFIVVAYFIHNRGKKTVIEI